MAKDLVRLEGDDGEKRVGREWVRWGGEQRGKEWVRQRWDSGERERGKGVKEMSRWMQKGEGRKAHTNTGSLTWKWKAMVVSYKTKNWDEKWRQFAILPLPYWRMSFSRRSDQPERHGCSLWATCPCWSAPLCHKRKLSSLLNTRYVNQVQLVSTLEMKILESCNCSCHFHRTNVTHRKDGPSSTLSTRLLRSFMAN